MLAAVDFSSFIEKDFSLKPLGLARYFVTQNCDVGERS